MPYYFNLSKVFFNLVFSEKQCDSTDSSRICLQCSVCMCLQHMDEHCTKNHHPLVLAMNTEDKDVFCFTCRSIVSNDNRLNDIALLRQHLNQIQTLLIEESRTETSPSLSSASSTGPISPSLTVSRHSFGSVVAASVSTLTPRSATLPDSTTKSHWDVFRRTIHRAFDFPFLAQAAVLQRKHDDKLRTAVVRWRQIQLVRSFNSWRDYRKEDENIDTFLTSDKSVEAESSTPGYEILKKDGAKKRKVPGTQGEPDRQTKQGTRKVVDKFAPGRTGLRNLGNTCYINSTLQTLSNLPLLQKRFSPSAIEYLRSCQLDHDDCPLSCALVDVFSMLWSGKRVVYTPDLFLRDLWNTHEFFRGFKQQDAHELITHIFDQLHLEEQTLNKLGFRWPADTANVSYIPFILAKHGTNTSIAASTVGSGLLSKLKQAGLLKGTGALTLIPETMSDTFVKRNLGARTVSMVECCSCRHVTTTSTDITGVLSLQIPTGPSSSTLTTTSRTRTVHHSLIDCLQATYSAITDLDGYRCLKCLAIGAATQKTRLAQLPHSYLVLHIVRTTFDRRTFAPSKIAETLGTEAILDMSPYLEDVLEATGRPVFQLVGVVNHHGKTITEGHYTSYAYNHTEDCWFLFNDANVSQATIEQVLASESYLLLYERQ